MHKKEENIAGDPFGAARFFHFFITMMLECLIGISNRGHQTIGGIGVLGRIEAYIGVVESQNCTLLHLHLLLWMKDTPTTDKLKELFKTSECRAKVMNYILYIVSA